MMKTLDYSVLYGTKVKATRINVQAGLFSSLNSL